MVIEVSEILGTFHMCRYRNGQALVSASLATNLCSLLLSLLFNSRFLFFSIRLMYQTSVLYVIKLLSQPSYYYIKISYFLFYISF